MARITEKKLFLGGRLRRLRRELSLTQSKMAEDLGVSPSYLNHLEHNQRPLTAQVLLRLAESYDIDLKSFSTDVEAAGAEGLSEVFADSLFRGMNIPRAELAELNENAPGAVEGIIKLYRAYVDAIGRAGLQLPPGTNFDPTRGTLISPPFDWVRDYIQSQRNHFPELEMIAEDLVAGLDKDQDLSNAITARLAAGSGVQVRGVPADMMPGTLRRYDHHRKRLFLSELLSGPGRVFALAYQLASLEATPQLIPMIDRAAPPDRPTRNLLRVSLTNYLAGAVLMPYEAFHAAAETSSHDFTLLRARFGVSYEQLCHRLTTLGRPNARGIPFFMLRVDAAGNISKRFAGGQFPFSRFGGTCPRWNIHASFKTPGHMLTQIIETQDGQRYFTLSQTVRRVATSYADEDHELAIGIGCELKYAGRLVYARGLDLSNPTITEVGPACRLCERPDCLQRAAEPINRPLTVEDSVKSISPYPFAER